MSPEPSNRPTGPYTAFQSIKTMVKDMKAHGVPGRIDRSVLSNFSGAVGGQILTALKFLGLTNDDGVPTDSMKTLVNAYDTDTWSSELAKVVKESYAPIFHLNLETASASQFNERFKATYSGTEDVLRKSVTFFLNATRDAQIQVSPYIMKNKKPRGPSKKRTPKVKTNGDNGGAAAPERTPNQSSSNDPLTTVTGIDPALIGILQKLKDAKNWDAAERARFIGALTATLDFVCPSEKSE